MRASIRVISGFLAFFILLFYSLTTGAVTNLSTEEQLDRFIENTVKKLAIPGMSVAIAHKGELIYSQVFGDKINNETKFYIGSTSKTFTALAIMQLVEQGKIDLEESVTTYLEDFTVSNKITVRHLLHHVSGMTEANYISALPPHAQFSDLIQDMNKMSLTYQPDERFSYFNQNYSLLGAIVEKVSGQSYIDYIEINIIQPLGLFNTSFHGEVDTPGHLSFFGFSIKRIEPYIQYDLPAGYITSTAEDLVFFLEALRTNDQSVGVSTEGINLMMKGNPFYGMGLMVGEIYGRDVVHHGGALPGYTSDAVMLVEDEYSFTYLMNKNHLLNGFVFNRDLTSGIVAILTEQEPPNQVDYFWMYRLLIGFFVLTLLYNVIKIKKIISRPEEKTISERKIAAFLNIAIPAAVVIVIPYLATMILHRGVTWELAFLGMPDMVLWLLLAVVIHLSQAMIHIALIIKNK
jgi:CubicO group peptidase (beta-lactamase class C family)